MSQPFLKVFVKNLNLTKGLLVEVTGHIRQTLIDLLEAMDPSAQLALEILQTLFGPNTALKLAVRRHPDILKVLTSRMGSNEVDEYLNQLAQQYKGPNIQEHFPSNDGKDEEGRTREDI